MQVEHLEVQGSLNLLMCNKLQDNFVNLKLYSVTSNAKIQFLMLYPYLNFLNTPMQFHRRNIFCMIKDLEFHAIEIKIIKHFNDFLISKPAKFLRIKNF